MNKINRKVEYALIGLKHMRAKAPGELTSVKELSQSYGCPFDATSRVMQVLAARGVLRSEQGAHGGYMIARDLTRVSFYDLTEMILGPVAVARCMTDEDETSSCEMRGTCNIVSPVQTLNRKLIEFYRGLSVSELLETRGSHRMASVESNSQKVEASRKPEMEVT